MCVCKLRVYASFHSNTHTHMRVCVYYTLSSFLLAEKQSENIQNFSFPTKAAISYYVIISIARFKSSFVHFSLGQVLYYKILRS